MCVVAGWRWWRDDDGGVDGDDVVGGDVAAGVVMVRGCGGGTWSDEVVMVYSGAWRGW
ncbi:hypothetical protein Tco_0288703, partial [Tanacetum coccineum]